MKAKAEKASQKQSLDARRPVQQSVQSGRSSLADHRPEMVNQQELIRTIHQSPQVIQEKQLGEMMNNSPRMQEDSALRAAMQTSAEQKAAPLQRKMAKGSSRFQQIAADMGAKYGVDTSTLQATHQSSFPEKVNAAATIQGSSIHFAPGRDTDYNIRHEVAHAIDNTLNGTPKGDKVVNGQMVDTTREKVVDDMAKSNNPLQRVSQVKHFRNDPNEHPVQRVNKDEESEEELKKKLEKIEKEIAEIKKKMWWWKYNLAKKKYGSFVNLKTLRRKFVNRNKSEDEKRYAGKGKAQAFKLGNRELYKDMLERIPKIKKDRKEKLERLIKQKEEIQKKLGIQPDQDDSLNLENSKSKPSLFGSSFLNLSFGGILTSKEKSDELSSKSMTVSNPRYKKKKVAPKLEVKEEYQQNTEIPGVFDFYEFSVEREPLRGREETLALWRRALENSENNDVLSDIDYEDDWGDEEILNFIKKLEIEFEEKEGLIYLKIPKD